MSDKPSEQAKQSTGLDQMVTLNTELTGLLADPRPTDRDWMLRIAGVLSVFAGIAKAADIPATEVAIGDTQTQEFQP